MTKDYDPSLTFTVYLDAFLATAVPPETAMSDLQKQLEDIKAQLAIVTNILPVVNELKEAYDSFNENQENPPTSQDDESIPEELLTNIVTASPAAHSQPSPRRYNHQDHSRRHLLPPHQCRWQSHLRTHHLLLRPIPNPQLASLPSNKLRGSQKMIRPQSTVQWPQLSRRC